MVAPLGITVFSVIANNFRTLISGGTNFKNFSRNVKKICSGVNLTFKKSKNLENDYT